MGCDAGVFSCAGAGFLFPSRSSGSRPCSGTCCSTRQVPCPLEGYARGGLGQLSGRVLESSRDFRGCLVYHPGLCFPLLVVKGICHCCHVFLRRRIRKWRKGGGNAETIAMEQSMRPSGRSAIGSGPQVLVHLVPQQLVPFFGFFLVGRVPLLKWTAEKSWYPYFNLSNLEDLESIISDLRPTNKLGPKRAETWKTLCQAPC